MEHRSTSELEAALEGFRSAPADDGTVELIVRRPDVGAREVLEEGELELDKGLCGDTWSTRPSSGTPDGSPHPDKQVTLVNARVIAHVAGPRERWPLAGDQLYVDLDIGEENLPVGARLALGAAVLEVTAAPHLGCKKFSTRFGIEALRFIRSPQGRGLRARGVHARVVTPGTVRRGDVVRKLQ